MIDFCSQQNKLLARSLVRFDFIVFVKIIEAFSPEEYNQFETMTFYFAYISTTIARSLEILMKMFLFVFYFAEYIDATRSPHHTVRTR